MKSAIALTSSLLLGIVVLLLNLWLLRHGETWLSPFDHRYHTAQMAIRAFEAFDDGRMACVNVVWHGCFLSSPSG